MSKVEIPIAAAEPAGGRSAARPESANPPKQSFVRRWLFPPFFSPQGFVQAAVVFAALWAGAHALGWRQNTAVISGTLPPGATGIGWPVLAGVAYALFYFVLVLIVPILLLAAAIFAGLLAWLKKGQLRVGPALAVRGKQ